MRLEEKRQVAAWVVRAKEGDSGAWDALIRFYYGRLGRFYCRRLRDPYLAEDLIQEALLAGFRSLHRLRDPFCFDAWICRVARNMYADACKERPPLLLDPDRFHDNLARRARGVGEEGAAFRGRALRRAMGCLRSADARALWDHHALGVRIEALCRRYGVSLSGMKMRLWRARKRLRPLLEDSLDGMVPAPPGGGGGRSAKGGGSRRPPGEEGRRRREDAERPDAMVGDAPGPVPGGTDRAGPG